MNWILPPDRPFLSTVCSSPLATAFLPRWACPTSCYQSVPCRRKGSSRFFPQRRAGDEVPLGGRLKGCRFLGQSESPRLSDAGATHWLGIASRNARPSELGACWALTE